MPVKGHGRMLAPGGLLVGLCLGLSLGGAGVALAEDVAPSLELLEFLGGIDSGDDEVLDMMVEEETGKTVVAGPPGPDSLPANEETDGQIEGDPYDY